MIDFREIVSKKSRKLQDCFVDLWLYETSDCYRMYLHDHHMIVMRFNTN